MMARHRKNNKTERKKENNFTCAKWHSGSFFNASPLRHSQTAIKFIVLLQFEVIEGRGAKNCLEMSQNKREAGVRHKSNNNEEGNLFSTFIFFARLPSDPKAFIISPPFSPCKN